ncbi:hypothetical protein AK812_SmicGene44703 [Symbiodinium microadriaticum]|uniref:Uncharacterized protein n=1 Tax=Symbiodinium microadriaticum TaxID=2951 RepID=A0A1Q9BXS5_SYMMI|nr:hypothetical protein AK812_SmicGene44703 [Symbiodinium microadriaticum]
MHSIYSPRTFKGSVIPGVAGSFGRSRPFGFPGFPRFGVPGRPCWRPACCHVLQHIIRKRLGLLVRALENSQQTGVWRARLADRDPSDSQASHASASQDGLVGGLHAATCCNTSSESEDPRTHHARAAKTPRLYIACWQILHAPPHGLALPATNSSTPDWPH